MEDLQTKLGYLRGLMQGLGVNEETKEGQVINQVVMILNELVDQVQEIREDHEELFSYVEAIDEDLAILEDSIENQQANMGNHNRELAAYDYGEDIYSSDEGYEIGFAVECPECREEVTIDEDVLEDEEALEVLCPSCGRVVFINDENWEEDLEALEDEDELDDGFEGRENE